MNPSRTRIALALVTLAALGSGPAAAGAQQGSAPAVVHSWALAPSGANPDEPGSRPNLSYEVAPGASVEDSVTLWNYGTTQLTFRTYATDGFNNEDTGSFEALAGDRPPVDVGAWVILPQANVTVPAGKAVSMPIRLTVPLDARPGDHAAAILASSPAEGRDADGRVVTLDRRTGSRLYLRVAGPLQPSLAVENVRTVYHSVLNPLGGSLDVSYTVRNTGNVRLGARQRVVVENLFGKQMDEVGMDDLPELLPGNAVVLRTRFENVTAAFRVTARPIVTPFAVGDNNTGAPAEVSRAGNAWAIPWAAFAVLLATGLGLQLLRRRQGRRPVPPPPVPPGGGAQVLVDVR